MAILINFFDNVILQAISEEIVPKVSFFKDRYFPTGAGDIFKANEVLTEYRSGDRKLAAFVDQKAGDIPIGRRSYEVHVPTPEDVDISCKADKATGATTGNFAALDGEGNLTDSGKKPADFVGAEAGKRLMSDAEGEKLAGVSEGATKTAASSTNGNVNIDGKEVVVYTEPENVLHDEDVEDFSAEEIAALLADAD